ncbi:MAG TPA: aminotransferase class III-fold pyridoxal phosphate-dependent enzyme, partial [Acidimicrobiales bacterium]|nr:aminotransferase class III-fold pyridoxal phosphate-dependent enzyme [Acidimicrobiales bacterium]
MAPLRVQSAAGGWIIDESGRRYFDGSSGSVCVNVGHANAHVVEALTRQAETVAFAHPGAWAPELLAALGERLLAAVGWPQGAVMFSTTGSAAMELAIKLAREVQVARSQADRTLVLTARTGFHGCTALTMALSGHRRRRPRAAESLGLEPSFDAPYPGHHRRCGDRPCTAECADEVADEIDRSGPEVVAAVVIEPVNGASGGGHVPPPGYLARLRASCEERGVLVVHDEVMVGLGRTGRTMAADHFPDAAPDITVVSKGLGAGYLPISA